ncbi:hypothetical protein SPRG_11412 [Saprolegnia parasitica CBS 223.65]|uniref:FYVE-type domain-containing protein n=2 Tax=Saprolegnia parasitica (strain CBS 223.65) TaxID=695850 RepID=A0A067BY67_SAPPC|nr:hypothetical protein SPRG_11412 [Saprolegnia parasitica CBS 223.65]KDO23489.1 hypothetical protein SPRG_11412 [Saprolegnia parasitica CBS 223.65]|eukprot:XP_012205803.1 hypothetical protein SPRG_11412 [Saprolegnia parasitica CBS 223.65]
MSQRSEDKHLLGWARSLWKTGKARKTGGVTQDAAVNSMAHPLRRCEPTPTSAARHVTVRTATRRPLSNLTSTSDDRGAANRSTWPWAFLDNVETSSRMQLVERGQDALRLLQRECSSRPSFEARRNPTDRDESVLAVHEPSRLVATYNQRTQLYTVTSSLDVAAKLSEVQDLVAGNNGDMLLYRIFGDDLQRLELARLVYTDNDLNCSVRKAWFRERGLGRNLKELFFLDHMEPLSATSFGRICKSVDSGSHPTKLNATTVLPRYTHCLFGLHLEATSPKSVRLVFYAEHCVYPPQLASSSDVRSRLESMGENILVIQQTLLRKRLGSRQLHLERRPDAPLTLDAACRVCTKAFHFFRRPLICSVCLAATCHECTAMEDVESPNGLEFRVPICCVCVDAVQHDVASTVAPARETLLDDDGNWSESSWGVSIVQAPTSSRFEPKADAACTQCMQARGQLHACGVCSQLFCRACVSPQAVTTRRGSLSTFDLLVCGGCNHPSRRKPVDEYPWDTNTYISYDEVSPLSSPTSSFLASSSHQPSSIVLESDARTSLQSSAIEALRESACLDMGSTPYHDALCAQALDELEVAHAAVCLIYKEAFMLKGVAGTGYIPTTIPSRCELNLATLQSLDEPTIVPDASVDVRFKDSPRVLGKESIRFFVGMPIVTLEGILLGTVTIADTAPRLRFHAQHIQAMYKFAQAVVDLVEYRHRTSTALSKSSTESDP